MKKSILIVLLFLSGYCNAQSWVNITDPTNYFSFSLPPSGYVVTDTLNLILYTTTDTIISVHVSHIDSISIAGNPDLAELMLYTGETDTLALMAQLMLATVDGTLVSYNVAENDSTSKDVTIGISFTPDDATTYYSFIRIIFKDSHFITMIATAKEEYLIDLSDTKDTLFDSFELL